MYPSNSKPTDNPNQFQAFWKPFIRVFQWLCISHYSVFRLNLQKNYIKLIIFQIYHLICSALHTWIIFDVLLKRVYVHDNEHQPYKESFLMFYVKNMGLIVAFMAHATSHIEAFCNGKHECDIYRKLNEIHSIFSTKLNYTVDYNVLRKKYICRTLGIFTISMILSVWSGMVTPTTNISHHIYTQIIHFYAIIFLRSREYQIALMFNALNDILMDLRCLLQ